VKLSAVTNFHRC